MNAFNVTIQIFKTGNMHHFEIIARDSIEASERALRSLPANYEGGIELRCFPNATIIISQNPPLNKGKAYK